MLTLTGISYTYPSMSEPLFEHVSASFQQGWTAVLGDNGLGKTTLLNIAIGMLPADTGSINKAKPELSVPVSLQPGESYDFTLLIDGTVAVLYINDQMALSTRMYALPEHQWGIFSSDSEVSLTNLQSNTL